MSSLRMAATIKYDLPASIIVFFVALPLCLGIALASGAPLFAGVIAGIVGGIVVGSASGSKLGVSGPAAGLAVIVLNSIDELGGWEVFLLAVVLAGIIQLLMGFLRMGIIAYFFPTSVIKGMLTGIGLIIILKQIPHALGYDIDFEGDLAFHFQGKNSFSIIESALSLVTPAAIVTSLVSLLILLLWENVLLKTHKIFTWIQGPLVAVIAGILLKNLFDAGILPYSLSQEHLVNIPVASSIGAFFQQFSAPDFSHISNPQVYFVAFTLAIIASLETLLCVEATDKLDPNKSVTPTNRELQAQGLGNIISGLIGGLPITQVIVRSSANITFGARSKLSTILHGFLLLICAMTIPELLNQIPLATLACILFVVGYKLAKPSIFISMYRLGWEQFIPFIVTVLAIVFTDLLRGIGVGMAVAIFYILRDHYRNAYSFQHVPELSDGKAAFRMQLAEEVSFLNKASILKTLNNLDQGSTIVIDASNSKAVAHDVVEVIEDFVVNAKRRNIRVEVKGLGDPGNVRESGNSSSQVFMKANDTKLLNNGR
ncbi:MAG TPA: SulP family inorganic anion transporter [Chryseolinea sp.]